MFSKARSPGSGKPHIRPFIPHSGTTYDRCTAQEIKAMLRKQFLARARKKSGFDARDKRLNKSVLQMLLRLKMPIAYRTDTNRYKHVKKHRVNVLVYENLEFEVNMGPLIRSLRKMRGYYVFLPKTATDHFDLNAYRLPMARSRFKTKECVGGRLVRARIDFAIVPVLGMDKEGGRIGFGKGMYDRFFAALGYRPEIVFVSRRANISGVACCDEYDIRSKSYLWTTA